MNAQIQIFLIAVGCTGAVGLAGMGESPPQRPQRSTGVR